MVTAVQVCHETLCTYHCFSIVLQCLLRVTVFKCLCVLQAIFTWRVTVSKGLSLLCCVLSLFLIYTAIFTWRWQCLRFVIVMLCATIVSHLYRQSLRDMAVFKGLSLLCGVYPLFLCCTGNLYWEWQCFKVRCYLLCAMIVSLLYRHLYVECDSVLRFIMFVLVTWLFLYCTGCSDFVWWIDFKVGRSCFCAGMSVHVKQQWGEVVKVICV